jgi:hypothetical protein
MAAAGLDCLRCHSAQQRSDDAKQYAYVRAIAAGYWARHALSPLVTCECRTHPRARQREPKAARSCRRIRAINDYRA